MRANNALAIIFANSNDNLLPELTGLRSMASIPFGGRYRIIDFHLSNFVNAGVSKVAIIPRANYRSLMDHIGSGKPWDLDRKKGGLSFLPPFIAGSNAGINKGHIDAINNIQSYIAKSSQEYVIICDADTVLNIDIEDMLSKHIKSGADVTAAYKFGKVPAHAGGHTVFKLNADADVDEVLVTEDTERQANYSLGIYIFGRDNLLKYSKEAAEKGYFSLSRGILQQQKNIRIKGYSVENYAAVIDSLKAYTDANMALLENEVRRDLFNRFRPVYTKTRDDMPTRYGLNSSVKNCIVGEGCLIDGDVENCVLFRGVKVGKGTVLRNCIIMQDTVVGDNCDMKFIAADKDVVVSDGRHLCGAKENYYIIKKGETV